MGYGSDCICYESYNENGEITSKELIDSLILFRNRNIHNNSLNLNYNDIFESNIINLFDSSSNNNSDSSNNNDISFQLDSRILESTDKLCPEKKRCIICLENFEKYDKIVNLSCLHMFHDECIRKWLNENNYCPICKNEV